MPLLSKLTGIGNCIYHISRHLLDMDHNNRYIFFYGYFSEKLQTTGNVKDVKFRTMQAISAYVKKIPMIKELARGRLPLYTKRFDVYFEPNFIPLNFQVKSIVTAVYDFSFHLYPEWHPKDRIDYFKKKFFQRIYQSNLIITNSNYVKEEAKQILKIEEDRIRVISMGYNRTIFNQDDQEERMRLRNFNKLPQNFLLFVGSIEPRKNLIRLLKAYLILPQYIKRHFKIFLVGFKGWRNAEVFELLNKMKENVEYLGYVNNEELADLYRKASCFIYPSLYEGFGLPPLEAMACGCPVVVSNVTSLPEVCGDAAYYIDPNDVENIAGGIQKVLMDEELRQNMIEKGLERAKLFSWEKAAKEHLKVFEEVLSL